MHNPGKKEKKKTNLASRQYSFEWGFWKKFTEKKQKNKKPRLWIRPFYLIIITSIININT